MLPYGIPYGIQFVALGKKSCKARGRRRLEHSVNMEVLLNIKFLLEKILLCS